MTTSVVTNRAELPITGIYGNLSFSAEEVWTWYLLPIPENEFGVYPEEAGLPRYLQQNLLALVAQTKKAGIDVHLLVSSPVATQTPMVMVGIKIGSRKDRKDDFLPKSFNKFINLLADAPLNDYISDKELEYWENKGNSYDQFFGANLGFSLASSNQLAYLVKKRFYPAMPLTLDAPTVLSKGQWGESQISEIATANIAAYPKYLEITQTVNGETVNGYRTGLEIIKYEDNMDYPEFEAWLPYVKDFPFIVDFSIRFTATTKGYDNISTRLTVEAAHVDEMVSRAEDLISHYEGNGMYIVWNSGDQLSLLNESIPTGKNADSDNRSKKSELTISNIIDNITFSKQDVYAWVTIPLSQFEYLDNRAKKSLSAGFDSALVGLVSSDEKNVECHMIIQGSPFDARDWIKTLAEKTSDDNPLPYNREFLTRMYQYVESNDFRNKQVLLGVKLGRRTQYSPNKSAAPTVWENITNIIPPLITDDVTDKEYGYWKSLSTQVVSSLVNSNISALPALSEEIAFAVRKNFFPEMPLPSPKDLSVGIRNEWKKNDIAFLADASIENNPRYLKITQIIDGEPVEGYRATLCFSKFPETMYFPFTEPWIHYASLLDFPTDFSLRFTLEPARKVRKEVGRKLKEVMDQAVNMESAGGNSTIEVNEHLRSGEELEYELKRDPSPWVYGRYRITVEASTVEELKERAKQIIDHYRSMEIHVIWPTGDQLSLLKEGLPNDQVRSKSYYHRTTLPIISGGVPAGAGTAGNHIEYRANGAVRGWIGPYLGYTTGHTQEPSFLSMHSTIDTDKTNGLAITGAPGSGKTFCTLTLTYQTVLAGAWTIYIDPKDDAQGLERLPGLQGHTTTLDLKNGNPGILDPFLIGRTLGEQKDLAFETIYLMLGGMDKITEEQQVQLAVAVETITSKRPNPSLNMIVDFLINHQNTAARSLGTKLDVLRTLPFSQLCFARGEEAVKLRPENGLTILTLLGLELPTADTARDSYSNANRLAVGVMYLLSTFTYQLMLSADKSQPKNIVIDEAWAITATKQGVELVKKIARMGRAHNVGLILVSQNAEDLDKEGINNSISTRLAFRATSPTEVNSVLSFLNLEASDTNRETMRTLSNGECIMKDASERIARVQIDGWDERMRKAFETNPRARAQNQD